MESLKIFVLKKKTIKRIPFRKLRDGDIFYAETQDGELDVEYYYGEIVFLWEATGNPEKNERGIYFIQCQPAEEE